MKHIGLVLGTLLTSFACGCGGTMSDATTDDTAVRGDLATTSENACQGVAGTWRGQVYSAPHAGYYEFTLYVARPEADKPALTGSIVARSWGGTTDETAPPETCGDSFHWTVLEPASGQLADDGSVSFQGTSWLPGEHFCGEPVNDYSEDKLEAVQSTDEITGKTTLSGIVTDGAVWSQAGMHIELTRLACD